MSSLFQPANELMVQYARYHRDRRNITTHAIGIPLIVFAAGVFLSRAHVEAGPVHASAAGALWLLTTLWYLTRGHLLLGLATSAITGVLVALAHALADGGTTAWFAGGATAFLTGWLLQFAGHYYEGRRPAFMDDAVGLLVGPMFVAGEALFSAGLCRALAEEIERRSGPTLLRDLAHPIGG